MLFTIVLGLFVVAFIWCLFKWVKFEQSNLPPGPKGYPIVGSFFDINPVSPHLTFEAWAQKYGEIFSFRSVGVNMVVLNSPRLIRKAFSSSEFSKIFNDRPDSFVGKYTAFNYNNIAFGKYNEDLFKLRKLMHQGLNMYGEGMINFEGIVQTELQRLVDIFKTKDGADFEPAPIIDESLAHTLAMLLCGKPMPPEDIQLTWDYLGAENKFLIPTVEFLLWNFPFLRHLPVGPGRMFQEAHNAQNLFLQRYFYQFKNTYDPAVTRGLVDVYLKLYETEKTWMNEHQLKALVLDTIGAGLITTCRILNGTLLALVNHQECLEKIYEEILSVVGTERPPVYSDRQKMPYTEAAILECQRFTAQIPIPLIHSCMKDVEFEGYSIPKKTRVAMNLWVVSQDKEIWRDPDVLRPERFLDDNGQLLPPDHKLRQSFFPFGIGRRMCIGEQFAKSRMFLYIATLVQKFQLLPPENGSLPSADPRGFSPGLMLEPPLFKLRAIQR